MSQVIDGAGTGLRAALRQVGRAYAPGADRPLRGYAVVIGGYAATVLSLAGLARALGRRPPERVPLVDAAMMAVATHKLSRLLVKDAVTSPLRAPFTRYEGPAGDAEINERPRGSGAQHAVGELVSCPFCSAVWIATGLTAGLVFAPRLTRLVNAAASAVAGADFLHLAYDVAKRAASDNPGSALSAGGRDDRPKA
jgi:uncharacterized protein DUF1360